MQYGHNSDHLTPYIAPRGAAIWYEQEGYEYSVVTRHMVSYDIMP